jgi:hypothetical protein
LLEGKASSGEPLHSSTELEQAAHRVDSAPKGRAISGVVLERSSRMQQDTRNSPDNTTTDDPQHEPHSSSDVESGNQAEEHTDFENYGRSSEEVMNNNLEPGTSVGDEQEVVQAHNHDVGEGGEGDEGDEGGERDEEEQTGDENETDARYPAGVNDRGAESLSLHVVKQKPKQDEKEPQRYGRQGSRLSSSATPSGGVNNTYGSPAPEEWDDTQGHADLSDTPAVTISS